MRKVFKSKIFYDAVIALFFMAIFVLCFYVTLDEKISNTITLINIFGGERAEYTDTEVKYDFKSRTLVEFPYFGEKYAEIKIEKMKLDLPVYHGDTLKILREGVGHYAGSYFPGENGTIILAAHNTAKYFKNLDKLEKNDEVVIETKYGTFKYIVDSSKIVKETDLDAFKIEQNGEKLIMYTCYPMHKSVVGRRTKRYVVYAHKAGEKYE